MATNKRDKLGKAPRVGRTPEVLRKGGAMEDKSKRIPRKQKHKEQQDETSN